jgi:peptidoglycan/LPS O-acetylase OafA/YrhL
MNGALWTIKIELMFYLSVPPILWLCRRLHRDIVLIALIFLSVVWRIYFAAHDQIARQLPGQLSCFLVGTLIFYHLAFFKRHGRILMFAAAALYLLHTHTGWLLLRPFAVSSLTLGACLLAPHVEGPARWGDFSYGTYVLHFPIIQSVVAMGVFDISPWLGLIVSLFLVAMAAVLSWKFIESPALRYGKARKTRQSPISAPLDCPPAKCNVP